MGQRVYVFSVQWISLQTFLLNSFQEWVKFKVKMPTFVIHFYFSLLGYQYKNGVLERVSILIPFFNVHRVFKSIVTNSHDEGDDDNKNNKWQCKYFVLKVPAPLKTLNQHTWNCQLYAWLVNKKGLLLFEINIGCGNVKTKHIHVWIWTLSQLYICVATGTRLFPCNHFHCWFYIFLCDHLLFIPSLIGDTVTFDT